MTRHYRGLKSSMDGFWATQSQRLKHLSISSEEAASVIKEKLTLANSIIKLSETCRKMETEQEKIIPFCPNLNEVCVGGSAAAPGNVAYPTDKKPEEQDGEDQSSKLEEYENEASIASASIILSKFFQLTMLIFFMQAITSCKQSKDTNQLTSIGLDDNNNEVEEWDYLNNFYKKFNKVWPRNVVKHNILIKTSQTKVRCS